MPRPALSVQVAAPDPGAPRFQEGSYNLGHLTPAQPVLDRDLGPILGYRPGDVTGTPVGSPSMTSPLTLPGGGPGRPDDDLDSITTRAELGAVLTELRRRSGRTLRELASEIGSSPSTLSGWLRAENLPFPAQDDTFRAMLIELGVQDPEPWMQALLRVRDVAGSRDPHEPPPYPGLEPFGPADADRFFGREALVERAIGRFRALLDDPARPNILLLVGASGSGKSSLLHAGLCPQLEADGYPLVRMTPGANPLTRLTENLLAEPTDGTTPRALLIDQFEELFTTCDDADERAAFLSLLADLTAPDATAPCAAVVALRIDFYAEAAATGHLAEQLQHAQVLIGPMSREELTRAIVEPARTAGSSVDDDLVELILRDFVPTGALEAHHTPGALPLLSHALLETWSRSRRGRMTVADYQAAGGLSGAIERSAELVYTRASPRERDLLRQVFLRLVNVETTSIATRRVATVTELEGLAPDGIATEDGTTVGIRDLLAGFVDARLLTAGETTIEISHESLLAAWPRLRRWIEADREALRVVRRITDATRLWVDNDRDPSLLARGVLLDAMREATATASSFQLTTDEQSYLDASISHAEAEQRATQRRTQRMRVLTVVASVFGLLAGVLAIVAVQARTDALDARDQALSREIALTTERLAETDPTLAAQLAVAGYDISPTPQARSSLLDAAISARASRLLGGPGSTALAAAPDGGLLAVSNSAASHVQLFVPGDGGTPVRAATLPLAGEEAESFALALSPDGQVLAVGDTTAAITLWDVTDPAAPTALGDPLAGPDGPIQGLSFSPDGRELAAVGLGDGAFRWDLTNPSDPTAQTLLANEEITWSVAHAPDNTIVAVGDDIGRVQLWDTDGQPTLVAELTTDERSVLDLAFSPDGQALAAGTRGGVAFLWDLGDPAAPEPLELAEATFDSWVNAVAFSPEADLVVGGSSDGALRVWSTHDGAALQSLRHPAAVTGATFTDAGATLVSTATDGTARRWDLATVLHPTLAGRIWSVGFTDDGHTMAAFSGAETGLWDVRDPAAPAPIGVRVATPADGPSFSGAGDLSPDGRLLAHGTFSGEVVVVDVSDPAAPQPVGAPLGGSDALVEAVAFDPSGALLAAGGVDTAVRIWRVDDLPDTDPIAVLEDPTEIVLNLAWSPSGRFLAAPSADNHVYLFDLSDPVAPISLGRVGGFESEAYGAAFTPDEDLLATAGSDAIVLLWDLTDPSDPQPVGDPLTGPSGRIFELTFDPDGRQLAGSVTDGSLWLWDLADRTDPQLRATLGTGTSPLYATSFHPSGELLAASGADQRVRLWHLDDRVAIDRLCDGAGDPLTEDEWQLFLTDRDHAPPCPR